MMPAIGDVVVLRGLRKNSHIAHSEFLALRIGIVVAVNGNEVTVRLHMCNGAPSRARWCTRTRVVTLENVARRASERESVLGHANIGDGGRRLSREEIAALYPEAVAS
jgi:hypothetical protein